MFFDRLQVIGLWERSFTLPDPITTQSLAAVEKSFVNAVESQIKYGPSSLSDYTKWRVGTLACSLRSLGPDADFYINKAFILLCLYRGCILTHFTSAFFFSLK